MSSPAKRREDLACDRALFGLDAAEEMELGALLEPTDDLPVRLERAAAAVALAEIAIDEPPPAHVAAAVLAAAAAGGARGRAGTVPMTPASAAALRSEARTQVMSPRMEAPVGLGPMGAVRPRGVADELRRVA